MWALRGVALIATPLPFSWFRNESSRDRIAVDVAEFFYTLSVTKYVEVVVAGFPDEVFCARSGEALLEDLNSE
jgi:hypothetical protein